MIALATTTGPWAAAVGGAVPGPAVDSLSCIPHTAITVSEDQGEEGFILRREPVTGRPVYRPGSGVTSGNGTAEDPYVIEDWCLDDVAIRIANTSAHVVVRDNEVNLTSTAIGITNATNVTIAENTVHDSLVGIRVQESSAVRIEGNQLLRPHFALLVEASTDTVIRSNHAPDVDGVGLWLDAARNATVAGNDLSFLYLSDARGVEATGNDLGEGLFVSGDRRVHYRHEITPSNTVGGDPVRYVHDEADTRVGPPAGQVLLSYATNVTVSSLTLDGADPGIAVTRSSDVAIDDVTIQGADGYGISARASDGVRVANSTFVGNRHGARLDETTQAVVADNVFQDQQRTGLIAFETEETTVEANVFADNGRNGLKARYAVGLHAQGNLVLDNKERGFRFFDSRSVTVEGNTLAANDYGLAAESTSVEAYANNITGNDWGLWASEGVDLTAAGNNLEGNTEAALLGYEASELDARENWWGHASGPSGGVTDACTGAVADGQGGRLHLVDAGVCFDPWLEAPNPDAGSDLGADWALVTEG